MIYSPEENKVAILIPSLNRPGKLYNVIRNIRETTDWPYEIYAVVSASDLDSKEVLERAGVRHWLDDDGYFCQRIQLMFTGTSEPWIFTGSDDVIFQPGWLSKAFPQMGEEHKVITFNDLHNPKGTNFLINREYVNEKGGNYGWPGFVYHPEYYHNFSDDDLVATAEHRGVFLRLKDCVVESTHPCWGNGEMDSTYQRASERWAHDEALYNSRTHLWDNAKYF